MDPRTLLNDRLKALYAEDAAGQDAQATVELDQQAIGLGSARSRLKPSPERFL